jgi:hypothetical protein
MSFSAWRKKKVGTLHRNAQMPATKRRSVHPALEANGEKRVPKKGEPEYVRKPFLLNDAIEQRICDFLRAGASPQDAAIVLKIGERTVREWRTKGAEEPDSRFGLFLERTEQARVEWKTGAIKKITDSSDWKASWKLLVARFPHEFRNYLSVNSELSGPDGGPIPMAMQPFNVVLELHDKNQTEPEPVFRMS